LGDDGGVTRFANSTIHQNVHEVNNRIAIRSILDGRIGVVSTNSLAASDLKQAGNLSREMARYAPKVSDFPGLGRPARYRKADGFDRNTADCTPETRAAAVKQAVDIADDYGFRVAGTFSTRAVQLAVLNSNGVRAGHRFTTAATSIIAASETSSGYAAGYARSVEQLDVGELARIAVEKCRLAQDPINLDPGEYEVILEPAAVADLLLWLGYLGLRSKQFEDGCSFMCGRIGEKITSDRITVSDDTYDPRSIAMPFDFEGVPRKKVVLIDHGVAKAVVHNRASAKRGNTRSTGHAMFPHWAHLGAFPLHLMLSPGSVRRADMVGAVKKGLLVTRFHYVRGRVDTADDVISGMTRDGTFLIENGKLSHGIRNLRFTDSVLRALATVKDISKEVELVAPDFAGVAILAPTLHLGSLRFTGKTEP
jgi:predicted Zn-dependent protease